MKPSKTSRRSRWRWQFTLRALLLAVLPVALALGVWQARQRWQAANFIRVETTANPLGGLDCDMLVKLRCAREFSCEVGHVGRGYPSKNMGQGSMVCRAQPIGSRSADRYGVDLRIRCRNDQLAVYPNKSATGTPVFRRDMRVPGLQTSNLVAQGQGIVSVPLDTPFRTLCFQSHYDDPSGSTSGSASDEIVIRCLTED